MLALLGQVYGYVPLRHPVLDEGAVGQAVPAPALQVRGVLQGLVEAVVPVGRAHSDVFACQINVLMTILLQLGQFLEKQLDLKKKNSLLKRRDPG